MAFINDDSNMFGNQFFSLTLKHYTIPYNNIVKCRMRRIPLIILSFFILQICTANSLYFTNPKDHPCNSYQCQYSNLLSYNDPSNDMCNCDSYIPKEVAWFQLFYLLGVGGVGNYMVFNYEAALGQFILGHIPLLTFFIMLINVCRRGENNNLFLILFDAITHCLCFPLFALEQSKLMCLWFLAVVLYISGLVWSINDLYYMLL